MDEATFDSLARAELDHIDDAMQALDPDDVEVSTREGVVELELRDGVRAVINSHRAARQIWMAAVASAWRFDYDDADGRWRTAAGDELRATIAGLIRDRIGVDVTV